MIKENDMTTLAEHLRSLNAKTEAWISEDPDNRWAGLLVEDLTHWAEIGVLTVRDFQRYEMETSIWDLYKEVTGIRPRHMDFASMSFEKLECEYDYLLRQLEAQEESDRAYLEHIKEIEREQEAEHEAWLAEQPEPIDYVACHHQEGWL
jgi:hypothetical protein